MPAPNPSRGGSSTPLILGGVGLVAVVGLGVFLFKDQLFASPPPPGNGNGNDPPPTTTISASEAVAIGTDRVVEWITGQNITLFGPTRNLKLTGKPAAMTQTQWDALSAFGGNIFYYVEFNLRDENVFQEFKLHTIIDAVTGQVVRFGSGSLADNFGI